MSELYKIKGKFQSYEEKVISPKFTVRQAKFNVDNTYGNGQGRIEEVPFEVWGKTIETVNSLKYDQTCEISFRVGANKGFVKLSAVTITPGEESDAIPM